MSFPAPPPAAARRGSRAATFAFACVAVCAACGSSDDDEDFPAFAVRTAPFNAVASAPVSQAGQLAVYLASEADTSAAGTDLNGDGDRTDAVAVRIDLLAGVTTNLKVAARSAVVVGSRVFVVVLESEDDDGAGSGDWNTDGDVDDLVLLVHSAGTGLAFVDELAGGLLPDVVAAEGRVWYQSAAAVNPGETTLRYVEASAPLAPVAVLAAAGEAQVAARPVHEDGGVLFCFLDETADGAAHNGDGLADDTTVLALVDATAATPAVRNTGLAVADSSTPMVAADVPGGDRAVAFLVSEAAQGESLNQLAGLPVGWAPPQCAAIDDGDTGDDVLHWLIFAEWDLDPVTSPPVNTGIAGADRILLFDDHVATLTPEDAQGVGCDYNESGTEDETVVRWVELQSGAVPVPTSSLNLAIDTATGGGASGLASLSGRMVAALDVDSNATHLPAAVAALGGKSVVGWINPASGAQWIVALRVDEDSAATTAVGVNWLAPSPQQGRLPIGVDESVGILPADPSDTPPFTPVSLNSVCAPVSAANDSDTTDTIVGWLRFASGPTALQLFGVGFAVLPTAPGIVIAGNSVFFRVSELHHDQSLTVDTDLADSVLVRRPLSSCAPVGMTILNALSQPSILTTGSVGALILVDESQTIGPGNANGNDLNGDGQADGFVMRFFHF